MDFGDTTVIQDLSFDVRAGETFGFLGSNGSGKTTTLRALLGIYQPTAGTLHIGGKPSSPQDGARLGYLPEERGLYKKETVLDVMAYFGRLKGLDKAAAKAWSRDYLERVGLADKANVRLDKLSGGQQQKVQLGVTIMNDPELLILDEPTKGFDPVNRRLLMDIIEEQKRPARPSSWSPTRWRKSNGSATGSSCSRTAPPRPTAPSRRSRTSSAAPSTGSPTTASCPPSALYDVVTDAGGYAELAPRPGARTRRPSCANWSSAGVAVAVLHHRQGSPWRRSSSGSTASQTAEADDGQHHPSSLRRLHVAPWRSTTSAPWSGSSSSAPSRRSGFWIATLSIPVIMAIVFALIFAEQLQHRGQRGRPEERRH